MSKPKGDLTIIMVKELLMENLTIPEYQRPYRWSSESALTLVNDSYEAFINNIEEYRMGTVVLHRDEEGKLNIVDGQQRITTLSIMFFVFDEILQENNYKESLKIFKEKYNKLSSEAIVNNLDIITRRIKEIDKDQLRNYIDYILKRCTFVQIITNSEQEAFQFFDSQNSRGKELAPHDLLKAYHLREMEYEKESEKVGIINEWESINQTQLKNLFSNHLFPLVKWYKSKDGLNYSTKEIKTFKGIKMENNYNFSIYNKAANLYIEKINKDEIYELAGKNYINKFQLTQPLISGKRFFEYTLYYMKLHNSIDNLVKHKFKDDELVLSSSGDIYVYNMFINVIMFYVDKFNMEALTSTRLNLLYKWAFSLRLSMKAVYRESVNKYAKGKSNVINNGLNMFLLISEMQNPTELDTVILENITKDDFKESKLNLKKYEKMYNKIFEEKENNNE